jgi:hypothetical protein
MATEHDLNDPTTPLFPLRVVSQLTHTSVYAIRQYVDLGLIIPYRTPTNRYLYSRTDIQRIHCIRKYLDEYGLNIAGIRSLFAQVPCWLIKPCPEEDCLACDAYTSIIEPCWQVTVKGATCQQTDCRTCNVYRLPEKCQDIKTLFKTLTSASAGNSSQE